MTISTNNAYQNRKVVYIYLDTNEEAQKLLKDAGNKVLLHLDTWQMWGKKPITDAWNNKTADWIIWPHQTSKSERWVLLVINVKENKAAVHTASQTKDAKAEEVEILNYLTELTGLAKPQIDTDNGAGDRTDRESALLAILYAKETLKAIKAGNYNYDFDNSDYDLTATGKEYDQLLTDIAKLKTIKEIEDNQEKHSDQDIKNWQQNATDLKKAQTDLSNAQDDIKDLKNNITTLTTERDQLKKDKSDLIKAGTTAAGRITTLENENNTLKQQLAAKPAPTPQPTPGGGGTNTGTAAETDEWIATAKFLTEKDFYKARELFNRLCYNNWTTSQKQAIYNMLIASNKNNREVEGEWKKTLLSS